MAYFAAATTNGPLVVSLAKNGITSDATNGLDYGVAAPAGATGQEAAINALLAAANTAAGNAGVEILWDVAVALGAPIYVYSNMTIRAPNAQCGAILRASANCPIWRTKGADATVSSNTSTQSQKNFGKIDATAFGTTTGSTDFRYRVFDATSINAKNITFLGGTWNGNYSQQTATAYCTTPFGFLNNFQFWGVNGVTIKGIRSFLSQAYNIHCVNCRRVLIEDCDVEQLISMGSNSDSIHFNGPCTDIQLSRNRTHNGDDNVALNADDGITLVTGTGTLTAGINWACSGAITQVRINSHVLWNGRENVQTKGAVRMLSCQALIDDVIVRGMSFASGQHTTLQGFLIGNIAGTFCLLNGTGNFGRVVIDDWTGDLAAPGQTFEAWMGAAPIAVKSAIFASLEVRNRFRNGNLDFPDIYVAAGANITNIDISGTWFANSAVSNNNKAVLQIDGGTVGTITVRGKSFRNLSPGAAPFVVVSNSSSVVGYIGVDADANGITNMVDVQAGTVTTVHLRGAHRLASGGSPLNVASGATVTNYGYSGLLYNHGVVAPYSGTGTVTRNGDYGESATVFATGATALGNVPGSATAGNAITGITTTLTPTGSTAYASLIIGGVEQTPRTSFTGGTLPSVTPASTGTAAINVWGGSVGGSPLVTSSNITVTSTTLTAASFTSGVPSSATVGIAITGVVVSLTPSGATAYASLTIGGTEQTPRTSFTGTSLPSLTPNSAGTTTINLYAAATGGTAVATSTSFTSSTSSYVLDNITATVQGAYGLRRLKAAYAGSAIRVQRSSDNAQQDIGFNGADLDTTALSTFVGSNSATVIKWYDQSGNAQDLVVPASTNAPTVAPSIVTSGTITTLNSKPVVKFTRGTGGVGSGVTAGCGLGLTGFTLGGTTTSTAASVVAATGVSNSTNNRLLTFYGNGITRDDSSTNTALYFLGGNSGLTAYQSAFKSQASAMGGNQLFQAHSVWNGTNNVITKDGTAGTTVAATGSMTSPGTLGMGCVAQNTTVGTASSDFWDGFVGEAIVIAGTYSGTDQTTVRNSQKTYYGTL